MKKKQLPYHQAHNKALNTYNKASMFLLWAGVLNILSALIGIIQSFSSDTYQWPVSGYSMSFSTQIIINFFSFDNLDMNSLYSSLIIIASSLLLGSIFCFLGMEAKKGKIKILIIGAILYLIDFILMFIVYAYVVPFIWTPYAFTLATHVVILIAVAVAIYQYFNIFSIEKYYKNVDKVEFKEAINTKEIASGK